MRNSQKIYDSTTINNIINKEHSIHFHKKNLDQIKQRKSRINLIEEEFSPPRKRNLLTHLPNGKKFLFNFVTKLVEDFELSMMNKKINGRLQTIISSPSRVFLIH